MIEARLFGSFQVRIDDVELPRLRSRKSSLLFALLLLNADREVERDYACQVIWPESPLEKSRLSLRQSLNDLRKALGAEGVRLSAPTSRSLLFESSNCDIDTRTFDRLADQPSIGLEEMDRFTGLMVRPLLEQFQSDFVIHERERRVNRLIDRIEAESARAIREGSAIHAVRWTRYAALTTPLSESVCRLHMEALAAVGDLSEAIRFYGEFRLRLWRELHLEPDSDTVRLYRALKDRGRSESEVPALTRRTVRPSNRLIGRSGEQRYLRSLLEESHLITIVGAAGMGKSRLAMELAVTESYPFVSLAPLTVRELLPDHIARELGLSVKDGLNATEALIAHLSTGPEVIVLDNAEHLIDACATLVHTLLSRTDETKLIVTSRVPLGIPREHVFQLNPLNTQPDAKGSSPALDLFVERAQRIAPQQLSLSRDLALLRQICAGLQGIPLALELAAARLRTVNLSRVAEMLDDQMKLLRTVDRTRPDGLHTMESAIRTSFEALGETDRRLFLRLSIFPAPFTVELAERLSTLLGDDDSDELLNGLGVLVDASLVFVAPETGADFRYDMFEAIRQFGRAELQRVGEMAKVEQAFVDDMFELTRAGFEGLGTSDRPHWMAVMASESAHWRYALRICRNADQYAQLVFNVASFWGIQGLGRETAFWLRKVIERREETSLVRLARALAGLGIYHWEQCETIEAERNACEAIEVARQSGDRDVLSRALNTYALALRQACRFEDAYSVATEAMAVALSLEGSRLIPTLRGNLGRCAILVGRYEEGREHLMEARGQFEARGLPKEVSFCDYGIAASFWREGEWRLAKACFERAMPVMIAQKDLVNAGWAFQEFFLMCLSCGDGIGAAHALGIVRMLEGQTRWKILHSGDGSTERLVDEARHALGIVHWDSVLAETRNWDLPRAVQWAFSWRAPGG
ncbi:MAG: BTAD domain-containing putative transcriptional regulator [Fimbriimonas sp.]|nr:BTAD domain-containing putative transcriptional regulator [Fimbriimonas sp.]